MFIFFFYILFKIIPPGKIQTISRNKNAKTILCENVENEKYGPTTTKDHYFIGCESTTTMSIKNCNFTDITLKSITWAHLMLFIKADAIIISNIFTRIAYNEKFIKLQEPNEKSSFIFQSNKVDDCHQLNGKAQPLINSLYYDNDIRHNIILLNKNTQTRAFEMEYHRGCKFINNYIKYANYDAGSSALLCNQAGQTTKDEIVISDCIFTECKGSKEGSIMGLFNVDYEITITNTTIEHSMNDYIYQKNSWSDKYYKGYFIQIQCSNNPAKANFIGCNFANLQSNAQSGGGIGLLLTNNNEHELYFEKTKFEHITFTHPNYCGGAISFSYEVEQNRKTKVKITNCTFNDISSPHGGGAVYYNAPRSLTIEKTKFINTHSNTDSDQKGGAIYVEYSSEMGPILIKDCYFEETESRYAGGIYIDWNTGSTSEIKIEGCHFNKTKAVFNGFAIMIQQSNSNTVTITNCYFIDCTNNPNYFAIVLDVSNLNFNFNTMTYSDPNIGGGCLYLEKVVNHNFIGNLFQNYKFDDSRGDTGGLYCYDLEGLVSFKFINNTFDNAMGNNQGRCIRFSKIPNNLVTFENNTIKNCPAGGPLVFLHFTNAIDEFTIKTSKFINNTFSEYWDNRNDAQLTPQFWIENPKNDKYEVKLNLKFDQCLFEKNVSPREGGAFRYGKSDSLINTKVIFQTCEFHENNAAKGGSAICIDTYQGCEINDCKFIKNRSEEGFGTINVKTDFPLSDPRDPTLLIIGSTFKENECKEGHAIYLAECTFAIKIMKCTFIDCGKNDYVISIKTRPQSVLIENNTIHFTILEQTAAPLFIYTENYVLKENIFQNIKNTVVRSYGQSKDDKGFQIIDNTFSKCSGDSVIDVENLIRFTPVFKGNTFIDITVLSQLMSLKLRNDIYDVTFDNNTFQNFAINSHFGGIGLEVDHESEVISISLSFKTCFFINNNNKEREQKGSAISCDRSQNSGNLQLTIEDCYFERNQNEGKGCAIYANIKNAITIDNCIFTDNIGSEKGSIYIVPDDSEISQIPIVISNCNFKHNQINDFSSIYVEPGLQRSIKVISCIFENEKGGIVLDDFKNGAEINGNHFLNTQAKSALIIKHYADSDSDSDKIVITGCTFDSCTGIDNKCFDIISNTRDFKFENNIIKNNVGTGHANYFGSFDFNKKISTFEVFNTSFINNVCSSLYGGGIGIQFLGIEQLNFNKCEFKENGAKQDSTKSRPTQNADQFYYNGDGGAIQLGYICTMNSLNVNFYECNFTNNLAQRHGGAIAIQTSMIVNIEGCLFESNIANYNFDDSSADLLTENHFHKKIEGRGGAIYINPSYTYDDTSLDCKAPDHSIQSVKITNCNFVKNNGFDGYGIYIEGDDINVPFTIEKNNFIDNYNKKNYNNDEYQIYGAVITTELTCIKEEQINADNIFSYSIPQLKVRNISYVDHYGKTPSQGFTKSEAFTQSDFIPTNTYTGSHLFSKSSHFSNTKDFSNSRLFSQTKAFSATGHFTKSKQFTATGHFTKSKQFTKSDLFTKSQTFTATGGFSKTKSFSGSNKFTFSNSFTKSQLFTQTNHFSPSIEFTQISQSDSDSISSEIIDESSSIVESSSDAAVQSSTTVNIESSSDIEAESSSNIAAESSSDIEVESSSNIAAESSSDIEVESSSNIASESSSNIAAESSSNIEAESSSDIEAESSSNIASESSSNIEAESSSNIEAESSSNIASESSSNIASESSSNIEAESSSNIASESSSDIEAESSSNIAAESSSDIEAESSSNIEAESSSNIEAESSSNIAAESSSNIASESSSDIEVESSSNIEAESSSNIAAESSSNIASESSSDIEVESSSNIAAESSSDIAAESSSNKADESSSIVIESSKAIDEPSDSIAQSSTNEIAESSSSSNDESLTSKIGESSEELSHPIDESTNEVGVSSSIDESLSDDAEESSSNEITEPPSEPKCKVYEDDVITYLDSCKYSPNSNGNKFVYVYVLSSNFTRSRDETSGGAININYCGIHCNNTCFIDCVAQSGGGGAIYVKNPINTENNATFIDLLFLRCVADYGGAIYHYSDSEQFDVLFLRCHFEKNKALLTRPSRGSKDFLFGGSALFLTCKNSLVQNCTFVRNLNGGAVKICNKFENNYNSKSIGLEKSQNKVSILGCNFEQDENSKNSIFYDDKKDGDSIEVVDCDFKGKLQKGSHYIDGEINVKEKIHVSSCNFENDVNDAVGYKLAGKIRSKTMFNNSNCIIFTIITVSLMIMLIIIRYNFLLEKSVGNKSLGVQDQLLKDDLSNENQDILV